MGLEVRGRASGTHRIDPRVHPSLRQAVGGAERHVRGEDGHDLVRVRVTVRSRARV